MHARVCVYLQTAFVVATMRCGRLSAAEQPDVVGPRGEFEQSVADMMDRDEDMTRDVAEMLVAAESMRSAAGGRGAQLANALRTMDEVQRYAADLYDSAYDDYLDLYPAWRMYILSGDPAQRQALFDDYVTLLGRYEKRQAELVEHLGLLVALQKALLPSNTYVDPYGRIEPSNDTAAVLDEF